MALCSVCSQISKELQCYYCKNWFHGNCVSISEDNVKAWSHNMKFACRSCSFDGEEYDARAALVRLTVEKLSCRRNAMHNQAKSEMLLIKSYGVEIPVKGGASHNTTEIDNVSLAIIGMFDPKKLDHSVPLSTIGDGNCMYRAVSRYLTGTESYHIHLRLLTTLELLLNRPSYDTKTKYNNFLNDIRIVTSAYDQLVSGAMQETEYAEMAHIYALSSALGQPIISYFPPQSSSELSSAFNRLVCGRNVVSSVGVGAPKITLMWTSTTVPSKCNSFAANHFVPLVEKSSCIDIGAVDMSSLYNCTFGSLDLSDSVPELTDIQLTLGSSWINDVSEVSCSKSVHKGSVTEGEVRYSNSVNKESVTEGKVSCSKSIDKGSVPEGEISCSKSVNKGSIKEVEVSCSKSVNKGSIKEVEVSSSKSVSHSSVNSSDFNHFPLYESDTSIDNTNTISRSNVDYEADYQNFPVYDSDMHSDRVLDSSTSSNDISESDLISDAPCTDDNTSGSLPSGFLEISEVFRILSSAQAGKDQIPNGLKENVYYIVENSNNTQNRKVMKRSNFSDDCGIWDSSKGTSPVSHFLICSNGDLKVIYFHDGVYCFRKQAQRKKVYVPMVPQPNRDSVVIIHRYYTVHKLDNNYRKKVTWLGEGGVSSAFALVEYLGKFPGLTAHGNSNKNNEYVRTPQFVMDEITAQTGKKKPHQIYNDLINKYDELTQPTSKRQIHDKQRRDRLKAENVEGYKNNYADHIRQIENLVAENHDFVRSVIRTNGRSPCIVLYSDEQLTDLKTICCNGDAVLGVDKTFMLCNMHVTVSCYKQISVNRESSGQHPIFLGPMYIHDNSDFETFSHFFHHIKIKLTDTNLSKLVIGTDDEKALVKAITSIFPEITHVLCTRHLEENARHALTDDAVTLKQRQQILKDIFGTDGLVDMNDSICFEEKCSNIQTELSEISEKFHGYFNKQLKGCLKEKVIDPFNHGKVTKMWTNNNCEAMNHVLKQTTDWKSRSLPEFVELAHDLVKGQYKGLRSALVGVGEYRLSETHINFIKSKTEWTIMTEKQRYNHYKRFRNHVVRDTRLVTSTDGKTIVLEPKTNGKKPCQRKRKPKTTTISAKRPKT